MSLFTVVKHNLPLRKYRQLLFHFKLNKERKEREVAQSCLTLCNRMDCSLPRFFFHGIFQARVLEWVAISFSRGSSQPRDRTWVSCIVGRCFYRLSHQGRWNKLNKSIAKKCKFSLSLFLSLSLSLSIYIHTHTHTHTHICVHICTHSYIFL